MTTEYQALTVLTLLFTFAWLPVSFGKSKSFGLKWLAGNRNTPPKRELPSWASRCERAYNNLKDYFPAFAVAVLVLGALGKFDETTEYAAWIFVMARFIHYTSYGMGYFLPRFLSFVIGLLANTYLLVKIFV